MTDAEIHAVMAAEYAKQGQALSDDKRRHNHFQCRLDQQLADKVRDYMKSRDMNANQALQMIISKFFN